MSCLEQSIHIDRKNKGGRQRLRVREMRNFMGIALCFAMV